MRKGMQTLRQKKRKHRWQKVRGRYIHNPAWCMEYSSPPSHNIRPSVHESLVPHIPPDAVFKHIFYSSSKYSQRTEYSTSLVHHLTYSACFLVPFISLDAVLMFILWYISLIHFPQKLLANDVFHPLNHTPSWTLDAFPSEAPCIWCIPPPNSHTILNTWCISLKSSLHNDLPTP